MNLLSKSENSREMQCDTLPDFTIHSLLIYSCIQLTLFVLLDPDLYCSLLLINRFLFVYNADEVQLFALCSKVLSRKFCYCFVVTGNVRLYIEYLYYMNIILCLHLTLCSYIACIMLVMFVEQRDVLCLSLAIKYRLFCMLLFKVPFHTFSTQFINISYILL